MSAPPILPFLFETQLGWMVVHADRKFLRQVTFGHPDQDRALQAAGVESVPRGVPFAWMRSLVDRLRRFAAGQPVDFDDVPIDLSDQTPFQQAVIAQCRGVRWGETATYGQLAARAGFPAAARAVGQCMATNRRPIVVPCHRVVAAGGRLCGFSAIGGLQTKRRLLEMERSGKEGKQSVLSVPQAML